MGIEAATTIAAFMANNAAYISAASMAISAAGAVAQHQAQAQQAKAQEAANKVTADNALKARNQQAQQLETRAWQERDAASERIMGGRIEALRGEGAVRAHAAGRGIEGTTVDAMAREYWAAQGRAEAVNVKTANNMLNQLQAEAGGAQAQYENRLNAMPQAREPSLWGLGLGITNIAAQGARDAVQEELRKERNGMGTGGNTASPGAPRR